MEFVVSLLVAFLCLFGGCFSNSTNISEGQSISDGKPPLIPRKVLYGIKDRSKVSLSPDGQYLAFLAPLNQVSNIWIQPLEDALKGKSSQRPLTSEKGWGIHKFFWSYIPGILLYTQDTDGDENYRLYKLNADTNESELLTDPKDVRVSKYFTTHRDFPDTVYFGLNNRDPRYHDIYRLNLTTGEKTLFFTNTKEFDKFFFDHKLKLRLTSKLTSDADINYYLPVWDSHTDNITEWKLYRHVKFEDYYTTRVLGFDVTNTKLYWIDSEGCDLGALVLRDFDDPTTVLETIYEPEKAEIEISDTVFHPLDHTPLAVYENYRQPELVILNESIRADFEYLQSLDRNAYVKLIGYSKEFTKWLVMLVYDNRSAKYFYYDRDQRKATYLFDSRKALAEYNLTKMHTAEVRTRDGHTQICYLSLPLENDPSGTGQPLKPGPLIVFPHGGPWGFRNYWGYNPVSQLLANRGYAVLQCNFRGSGGYGKTFLNLGNGEYAGKMHNDLVDGAEWAIGKGVADREKIGIYGASYGGYSALVGVTFTADFFACGVDMVGMSNLATTLDTVPPYWESYRKMLIKRTGGDPRTEQGRKFLESRSPLFFVENITKPLLIAHGAQDPRVKKSESDQIYEAMKMRKIPVTYLVFPDEGHGFRRPENDFAFMTKAEKFLADCLGGRAEPKGEDSEGTSMEVVHEGDFQ